MLGELDVLLLGVILGDAFASLPRVVLGLLYDAGGLSWKIKKSMNHLLFQVSTA